MRRTLALVTLAVTGLLAFGVAASAAPDPFAGATSTAGGYYTWDADQIDAEGLAQTGNNVYVAVLDTGLVPNWKDYFPDARVATNLGTGFHQPVSFKAKKDECGLGVEIGQLSESTWVGSTGSTHGTHVASAAADHGAGHRAQRDDHSGSCTGRLPGACPAEVPQRDSGTEHRLRH
jgi:hypothetical protein